MGSFKLVTETSVANPNAHDLFLDDSGQLVWIGGDINDKDSYAQMIAQRIECRIKLVKGEWYLDQREGVPWKERIWVKGVTEIRVRNILTDVLNKTPGVATVVSVSVTIDSVARSAAIQFSCISDQNTQVTSDLLDAPILIEEF